MLAGGRGLRGPSAGDKKRRSREGMLRSFPTDQQRASLSFKLSLALRGRIDGGREKKKVHPIGSATFSASLSGSLAFLLRLFAVFFAFYRKQVLSYNSCRAVEKPP